MPHRHVGAVSIAYWLNKGPSARAGGAPLVIVHGLAGSAAEWTGLGERFHPAGATLCYDLRGHGDSGNGPAPERTTIPDLTGDLAGLLLSLGMGPVHLLGHSLGGIIALDFALHHPGQVVSLTLISATPEAAAVARSTPPGLLSDGALPAGGPASGAVAELSGPNRDRGDGRREAAHALMVREDLTGRLEAVVAPTLVIAGEFDSPLIQRGAELLHGWIANSRLVRIAGAGHHPHREQPEALAELVGRFIREVDSPLPSGAQH